MQTSCVRVMAMVLFTTPAFAQQRGIELQGGSWGVDRASASSPSICWRGVNLAGPLHVKGGFTWGLMDDSHPFQPVVLLAWKP